MRFKKGEGGRPKGVLNKRTREVKEFTRRFLTSPAYVKNAEQRMLEGKAPHLEVLWHHYAYGKPKETVQVDGQVPAFVVKLDGGHGA
jgi:hypothetical protein